MKRTGNHQQRFLIVILILIGLLIGYSLQQTLRFYRNESNHIAPKSNLNLQTSDQNEQVSAKLTPEDDDAYVSSRGDPAKSTGQPKQQQKQHTSNDKNNNNIPYGSHHDKLHNPQETTLSSSMLKSFLRINSMRAYHLDLHSYRDEVKFGGDPAFVDSLSETDKKTCANHLTVYHDLLKQYQSRDPISELTPVSALELADTFGRPEAAVLNGNQFWLGNYERCQSYSHRTVLNETLTDIKGHYCLGVVQFPNWTPSEGKTSLKIGLCLPERCTNHMLNDENANLLQEVQQMMMYQINPNGPFAKLQLRNVYCLPHETSQLRKFTLSAQLFVGVIGCFLTIAILATILDSDFFSKHTNRLLPDKPSSGQSWKQIIIESFSITRNIQKFFHLRDESGPSRSSSASSEPEGLIAGLDYKPFDESIFFNSMAGIKTIGLFWIIAAHTFLVSPILSTSMADLDKITQTYLADIYLAAHLMVDTFFVLMGMIASYLIFKGGIHKMKAQQWIIMTVHRYWRLTPIYIVCYWFTKSLGSLVNSGPLWDYATSETSPRVNCARESWFTALLHLSDFKSPKEHCVPFAWFIANSIKFCIITPLFLIPLGKSMKRGYSILMSALLANTVLVYWLASKTDVDVKAMIEFKPESADNMLNNMGEIYTRPYSRIGAYLIGLIAGHLFYLEKSGLLRVKLGRDAMRIGWTLCVTAVLGLIFLLKILRHIKLDESMMQDSFSAGSALVRPIWSLCSCWLVFALAHGETPWLSKFLSARFWLICVKLSFCAYLSQGEVIANIFLASPVVNTSYQYLNLISYPLFVVILTVVLSFLMVIFIEYPLSGIEQIILPEKKKNNSKLRTEQLIQQPDITLEQKVK